MNNTYELRPVSDEEIAVEMYKASGNKDLVTSFWRPLTGYSVNLIREGSYSKAQSYLFGLLHKCREIDPNSYVKIHKGNPFYFLGISSFLLHDYQTATYFFDASVSEDLRYGTDAKNNPSPSTRFLALEGEKEDQAAKQLTRLAETKVKRAIEIYNSMISHQEDFSIEELRERFLFPALSTQKPHGWRTLVTVFISFFIEWDFRNQLFDLQPNQGTLEPFYIHLFKGCVLFESLLKENSKRTCNSNTLGKALRSLYRDLELKEPPKISSTFDQILTDVFQTDNSIATAISFTGKVRNTTGHRVSWNDQIEKLQYQRLFEMISVSCLHAIACLY